MVSAPSSVQVGLPKLVHSSHRPICHTYVPKGSPVHISNSRPTGLETRCSVHKLVGSPTALLHKVIQKLCQCNCLIIQIAPYQAGKDALVLGPRAALNKDSILSTSVSNTPRTVPQPCGSQQPTMPQPSCLASRSKQFHGEGFSLKLAERIAASQRSSSGAATKGDYVITC